MKQTIARIRPPRREMVGIFSTPDAGIGRASWLFFNPFGQEAVRSKPMYRVLAERLADDGINVLRFDPPGCGDSPGDADAQTIEGWIGDALAADAWLRERVGGATPVRWFGLRLGATLALQAAARALRRPDDLLLWDPVLDGPRYSEELRAKHRDVLSLAMSMDWDRLHRLAGEPEPTVPGRVLGFSIGPALAEELRRLAPRTLPIGALAAAGTRVSCALAAQDSELLAPSIRATVRCIPIDAPVDWTSGEALGTAIVPPVILRTVRDFA